MNAEIISIGSELLLGQIVDTNAAWMAQHLADLGVNLYYKTVVGDNPNRMRETLSQALGRSDVVITTGGIGPTEDDLTREVVAEVTDRQLLVDERLLQQIKDRFGERGIVMTPNNEKQAYIPSGAIPVENPNGTAPSFIVEDPRGVVISLPGVPVEMKWLFEHEVVPYLREKFGLSEVIVHRVLKVAHMGESSVDHKMGHLIVNSSNPTVGVLAHPGQVDVRITAKAADGDSAIALIRPLEEDVRMLLGDNIFAADDESMEDALCKELSQTGMTIAVYEDLTGGMTAQRLQQASPDRFLEGVVGGSRPSIERVLSFSQDGSASVDSLLGDDPRLTDVLAKAVRVFGGADLGLAVHMVPEGDGRSESLGPGNSYISLAGTGIAKSRKYHFAGLSTLDRTRISLNALDLVRRTLMEMQGTSKSG